MTRILVAAVAAVAALLMTALPVSAGESAAHRLAEAVRFKTISYQDKALIDYAEFRRFHVFLRENFPQVFSQLEVETVSEHSLVIRWPGSDSSLEPVLFAAHMDVVPIESGTEQDWPQPPFAGVIADGNIYGRGTLDDKQGVMGLLEATESLLADGFKPARTIVFAFGHDEEISGKEGAVNIARLMRSRGWHFAWMVDEGGMIVSDSPMLPGKTMAIINVAEKGYLTLTLVAKGQGGHSSRPPKISTIGRLSAALTRLERNPFPTRLVAPVRAMLESMAPHMEQPERFVFSNLWLTEAMVVKQMAESPLTQSYVRTTTALTIFNAGVKENVVPQRAEAKVNFRLLPGDTAKSVVARVRKLIDDPEIEILYDAWGELPPAASTTDSGFTVISEAVQQVYPDAVITPSLLTATTDTRHYVSVVDNLYRFHGMLVAAEQMSTVHGTGEYVSIESYQNMIEVTRHMLRLGAR